MADDHSCTTQPTSRSDALDHVVDFLLDTCRGGDSPTWVRLLGSPGDPHLVVLPEHPVPLGWVAPPDCWAAGMVGGARAIPVDQPDAARTPVQVACMQARSGLLVARVVFPDGTVLAESPPGGRMVDVLRRTFRLPTDPPAVPASHLLSIMWLEEIIDQCLLVDRPRDGKGTTCAAKGRYASNATGRRGPAAHLLPARVLTWPEVCALHPCGVYLPGSASDIEWEDAVVAAASQVTWRQLHDIARSGPRRQRPMDCSNRAFDGSERSEGSVWGKGGLDADLARWMDTGMFARWLLDGQPLLDALRQHLTYVTDDTLVCQVGHVVDRLDGCGRGAGW